MAYSATLANVRGILSDGDHQRILNLFSKAGLSMDHHQFDEDLLDKGTRAILRTRDGLLRAAVPSPLGKCTFLNDVSMEDMYAALRTHKQLMKRYPRHGEGLEAFVDASDTGYTMNGKPVEINGASKNGNHTANGDALTMNGSHTPGVETNGGSGLGGKMMNGSAAAIKHAAGADTSEKVAENGMNGYANEVNGRVNGMNGHANGTVNGH